VEILSARTIIHPSDLDRSWAFYRDRLGLAVAREFGAGDHRGTVFFAGGGLLEVTGAGPAGVRAPGSGPALALWLQVRDVRAAVDELASVGVPVSRQPQVEPWGLVEAWVDDPDGLRIHLVEVPADHPLRRDTRAL